MLCLATNEGREDTQTQKKKKKKEREEMRMKRKEIKSLVYFWK